MDLDPTELFREAMSHLAAGVAVVTARRPDGLPCGLSATSVTSYSAHPPSLLVSVWHRSRCHATLAACDHFGVHLLRSDEIEVAHTFADRTAEDKFAGVDWGWDGDVPELAGTLVYVRCRRAENFVRYDHTVLIGDVARVRLEHGAPLVYSRRRMDWLLGGTGN